MPLLVFTNRKECLKERAGKTGMAIRGLLRVLDMRYEDSDISEASNS